MSNPAGTDPAISSLAFEAQHMDEKNHGGFHPSLGLNPMSADDPSWIGHGFQAQAAEDFLSSPDWTDPSPALTDSMSFELDSCGPSPLLSFDDTGYASMAGAPLFPPQKGYASSNVSPVESIHNDFSSVPAGDFGASEMGPDFTLFPEAKSSGALSSAKLPAEMAFSQAEATVSHSAFTLLRALSSAALSNTSIAATAPMTGTSSSADATAGMTASPLMLSSSIPPTAVESTMSPLAPSPVRRSLSATSKDESRGTKRKLDTKDLLPLNAPIQSRTYHAVSATSRRDTSLTPISPEDPFAAEEAALRRERDPRVAKRLSNTLAARRSRHRKAEELRQLHEVIDSLRNEVESLKRRCEQAEEERDEARSLSRSS